MRKLVLICFLIFGSYSYSQRYVTVAPGDWDSPATWQNGNVPSYTFSDTVLINHRVTFDSILSAYGYFRIDVRGGICGQHLLNVYYKMDVFGFFWVDSLDIFGGDLLQMSAQNCISTKGALIHGAGASFSVHDGESFMAGIVFDCGSEFMTVSQEEIDKTLHLVVYPNPTSDVINIEGDLTRCDFILSDYSGKIISQGKASEILDVSAFENGVYFLQFIRDGQIKTTKKVLVYR